MSDMPNLDRAYADHRDVLDAYEGLIGTIRARMDLRRYELATLAAARALRSSYCSLAHGQILSEQLGEDVVAIVEDPEAAGLDAVDRAVMTLAARVVGDASTIGEEDRRPLRDLGLRDDEIMDVILAAAARCFFSKSLDAAGAQPDARFAEVDPALRAVLVVGRPIADA